MHDIYGTHRCMPGISPGVDRKQSPFIQARQPPCLQAAAGAAGLKPSGSVGDLAADNSDGSAAASEDVLTKHGLERVRLPAPAMYAPVPRPRAARPRARARTPCTSPCTLVCSVHRLYSQTCGGCALLHAACFATRTHPRHTDTHATTPHGHARNHATRTRSTHATRTRTHPRSGFESEPQLRPRPSGPVQQACISSADTAPACRSTCSWRTAWWRST